MFKQDDNTWEKSRNNLDDVIGLLRIRLMEAVHNEVNSCGETVARILDGAMLQVVVVYARLRIFLTALELAEKDLVFGKSEGSLATASYEGDMMEDESEDLSDQLGDCDHEMDIATAAATKQCEEVMAEKDWENWSEDSRVPKELELSNAELEHLNRPEGMESIIQKILTEAAKVVINMLENAGTDECIACDDYVSQHDHL
ncbi:unnamed protein product [Cercopithifilaria johnstoni]|uniref:Uncharacterized protein n=1 Tax=Cercopithifilaria johnstoni TaxID=2874296 RepID=A0A8J2MV79_9BILA|nr:unnamed protein product [Cercopithifilaria johnstoni]